MAQDEKKPTPFRPSRLMAFVITGVVVGAGIQDQLSDGELSPATGGLLIALVAIWSGLKVDNWFSK